MKRLTFSATVLLSVFFLQLQAQKEIPKGFTKGRIILPDSVILTGFIKENIHGNASVSIIIDAGKKQNFNGNELLAVEIDSTRFICIKGDFFKILCDGDLYFLQKASDASGKPVYNGTEAVFMNGTEGKINDYFFYDRKQQQLKLLTKRNIPELVAVTFNNYTPAISKAKETGADLAGLKQAVDIYNNRNGK